MHRPITVELKQKYTTNQYTAVGINITKTLKTARLPPTSHKFITDIKGAYAHHQTSSSAYITHT